MQRSVFARVRLGLLIAASLVSLGCADGSGHVSNETATGRDLYVQACSTCHGIDLEGSRNGPALDADAESSEALARIIADGRGAMPGFADELSDGQIDLIVEYLVEDRPTPSQ